MSFFDKSKSVTELTPDDFEPYSSTLITKRKCSGLLIYAPWCPHCINFKNTWEKFAEQALFMDVFSLNAELYKSQILKINEEDPSFINGYPTIIFYKDNKIIKYKNNRDTKTLLNFAINLCTKK